MGIYYAKSNKLKMFPSINYSIKQKYFWSERNTQKVKNLENM